MYHIFYTHTHTHTQIDNCNWSKWAKFFV